MSTPKFSTVVLAILLLALALAVGAARYLRPTESEPLATSPIQGKPIDAPPISSSSDSLGSVTGRRALPTDPLELAKIDENAPAPRTREGYEPVSWERLSNFDYEINDEGELNPGMKLPQSVKVLDGSLVSVSGFMIPIEVAGDRASLFILVRSQLLCCFGQAPQLNEWILVRAAPPLPIVTDVPLTVFGVLEVGPEIQNRQILSLYRLKGLGREVMQ